MAQNETSAASSGSSSSCLTGKIAAVPELDRQLAGAGYRVRSSELNQVAEQLERLETVMVNAPSDVSQLAYDAVYYNPSDLASWVDSLLSEFAQPLVDPSESQPFDFSDLGHQHDAAGSGISELQQHPTAAMDESWIHGPQQAAEMEEDSGVRLVHTLMTCAESLQRGDLRLARTLIEEMRRLLERVHSRCGIWKVAAYFVDALNRRVLGIGGMNITTPFENELLYHHYYEACPYLKFAHFTANQAILEAFEGHDCVHVVDFNLMHGLQWPALIQALALRSGGPPLLRLTGIGPPSPDGQDPLREIGHRLAELARSVNVSFAFRGVAAPRLEDVKPWMLQVNAKEAVAVNSIMQFHRLLASDSVYYGVPIESVLTWIRSLKPRIVMVIEQEANHNQPNFLDRFTEALYYYSTMFDSLEACGLQGEKQLAEVYLQREICNVLCCEGSAREERHEPLSMWRSRLMVAGFKPLHLGSNAFKQASMLLTLFSAEGYSVEEKEGCLTLGWHSRPLVSASAWQADQ